MDITLPPTPRQTDGAVDFGFSISDDRIGSLEMGAFPQDQNAIRQLRKLRVPNDYFSRARSSPELWPERILCFTRKTLLGIEAEPPARHHHHRYVLVIPWEGKGQFDVDDRQFLLSPGEALLILPFQFHRLHHFQRSQVLWQIITFELRPPVTLDALGAFPVRKLAADDLPLVSAFIRAWTKPGERDGELAPWLSLILDRFRRAPSAAPKRDGSSPSSTWNAPEDSLMASINRRCLPRLHEIFGLKDLASWLGISESHLRARFHAETGVSLGRHVRRLRLQKAMGLLAQSNLSVTQVAERCGFDTVFTFSRSFRNFVGISAKEYRKRRLAP